MLKWIVEIIELKYVVCFSKTKNKYLYTKTQIITSDCFNALGYLDS